MKGLSIMRMILIAAAALLISAGAVLAQPNSPVPVTGNTPIPPADCQALTDAYNGVMTDLTSTQNLLNSAISAMSKTQTDAEAFGTALQAVIAAQPTTNPTPTPTPTPAPPAFTESADGTQITPGSGTVTDANGDAWTLTAALFIQKDGANAYNGWQSHQLVYKGHRVFIKGLDGNWYSWSGAAFVRAAVPN